MRSGHTNRRGQGSRQKPGQLSLATSLASLATWMSIRFGGYDRQLAIHGCYSFGSINRTLVLCVWYIRCGDVTVTLQLFGRPGVSGGRPAATTTARDGAIAQRTCTPTMWHAHDVGGRRSLTFIPERNITSTYVHVVPPFTDASHRLDCVPT